MTTLQTSKRRKTLASHVSLANRVNRVNLANLVVSVKSVPHVLQCMTKAHTRPRQPKLLLALACHASKRSACLWLTCKPWPKAVVWSGSTPTPSA